MTRTYIPSDAILADVLRALPRKDGLHLAAVQRASGTWSTATIRAALRVLMERGKVCVGTRNGGTRPHYRRGRA